MANHGKGHIKQKLTVEQINSDLLEINHNRFNDCFTITHENHGEEIWLLILGKEEDEYGFQIWFNIKENEIEWPHTHNGSSGWWFQETFVSLLISKYDGMISDDGCDGEWKPEFHIKYPHMIDWFMITANFVKGKIKKALYKKMANGSYKEELQYLPKEIISVI